MARYPALPLVPLAACLVLSLDAIPARAQYGYPQFGRDPAATALLTNEAAGEPEEYRDDLATADDDSASDRTEASGDVEIIRERFPNGSIKIEREVTQDADGNYVNHGSWKLFDERGTVLAEGHYRNGERDGTWNRWYRGNADLDLLQKVPYQQFVGPFISQATFQNGKLNGKWAIYDSKQRKISEWHFTGGNRDGKAVWYFANGRKMREIDYRDGEIDGEYNEWNADGRQIVKDTYQTGRKLAPKIDYYGNKQKKSEGMYLYAKEIVQSPDDWWNAKLATYIKQGKDEKHGAWTQWYQNGQKQMQGEYRNDFQIGKFFWWYQNGQVALEGAYDSGKQTGKWVWWHANGQRSTQGEYADGNPTGRWRWWDTNGRVHETADLTHAEGKVVEAPAPAAVGKNNALLPHPAAPKIRSQLKR